APAPCAAGDRLPRIERHELAIDDLMARMRPERAGDVAAVAQHVHEARLRKATEDLADAADVARRLLGPALLAGLGQAERGEILDESGPRARRFVGRAHRIARESETVRKGIGIERPAPEQARFRAAT